MEPTSKKRKNDMYQTHPPSEGVLIVYDTLVIKKSRSSGAILAVQNVKANTFKKI